MTPLDIGYGLSLLVLGALWRVWTGMNHSSGLWWQMPKKSHRNVIGFTIALIGAVPAVGNWWALWVALLCTINIVAGYTDWPKWWMPIRYGAPMLLVVAPSWFGAYEAENHGLGIVVAATIAGASYPVGLAMRVLKKRHPTRWAEAINGAAQLGAPFLLI